VSHLELLVSERNSWKRVVCISEGVRFIAGDTWYHTDDRRCSCLQVSLKCH